MSSITYLMCNSPIFMAMEEKMKEQDRAAATAKAAGLPKPKRTGPSKSTVQQHKNHAIHYAKWCRTTYGCREYESCRCHIQEYADFLIAQGKAASTIHTYLAGVCFAYGIKMQEISKPIRYTSDNKQGRGHKESDNRPDRQPAYSPRLTAFAECVGIRRSEYQALKMFDLGKDELGYDCVIVRRGKGGKAQMQRVPLNDVALVRSYFDGSKNFVFTKGEMDNKINLHHLRHCMGWRAYRGYLDRLEQDAAYRSRLTAEVKARWVQCCKRPWRAKAVQGQYHLRGKNRELAVEAGFPVTYDRLALMAVSVFHLSHWRADVTVDNYILAVAKDSLLRGEER